MANKTSSTLRKVAQKAAVKRVVRYLDIHEGDKTDEKALQALIRTAMALNTSKRAADRPVRSQKKPKHARGAAFDVVAEV